MSCPLSLFPARVASHIKINVSQEYSCRWRELGRASGNHGASLWDQIQDGPDSCWVYGGTQRGYDGKPVIGLEPVLNWAKQCLKLNYCGYGDGWIVIVF